MATAVRTVRSNKLPHGLPMPFVEPPQGIVVGMLPPGQPQVRYLVPAGRLQLSARAHTDHEAVSPPSSAQASRSRAIDELGDEPRRMIQRQQLVKRRRQHPHLLSAHRSKRHLNISHLGVASNVHLTHTQRQPRLLRQAQIPTFVCDVPLMGPVLAALAGPLHLVRWRLAPRGFVLEPSRPKS